MFPSPFGVICSLIELKKDYTYDDVLRFPSPFGVICSLIVAYEHDYERS